MPVGGRREKVLWCLVFSLLAAYLLSYAAYSWSLVAFPFDYDQGEGYDVYSAWLLSNGHSIYNDNSRYPYFSSNYPPVYFLSLAPVVAQIGPSLAAGRALSAVSVVLAGGLIFLIVRQRCRKPLPALLAGLFFLSSNYVYHVGPLARANSLTLLLALAAVYAASQEGVHWRVAAVVALLLALYAKPSAMDAAAAVVAFAWLRKRRDGILAGAAVGGTGLALLTGLDLATHGQFATNVIVGNVNPFSWSRAFAHMGNFLLLHQVLLLAALAYVAWSWKARRLDVWVLYFLASVPWALTSGKWGAGESYFLEAVAATCVLFGLEISRPRPLGVEARGLVPALLVWQGVLLIHGIPGSLLPGKPDLGFQSASLGTLPTQADVAAGRKVESYMLQVSGDVLAEEVGFNLAAGKRVVGNATQLRNLYEAGAWDPTRLVADLDNRRYSAVILHAELYPEPVLAAIGRNYGQVASAVMNGGIYRVFEPLRPERRLAREEALQYNASTAGGSMESKH